MHWNDREPDEIPVLVAHYWADGFDVVADERAHSASREGIFVRTPEPPAKGKLLSFELCVDGEDPPLRGVARVVSIRRPDDGMNASEPDGMIVRFIHFDDLDHARAVLDRVRLAPPASPSGPSAALDDPEERAFFASKPPAFAPAISIEEELGIVDVRRAREADPRFQERKQRLRRGVVAVVVGAATLAVFAWMARPSDAPARAIVDAPAAVPASSLAPSAVVTASVAILPVVASAPITPIVASAPIPSTLPSASATAPTIVASAAPDRSSALPVVIATPATAASTRVVAEPPPPPRKVAESDPYD